MDSRLRGNDRISKKSENPYTQEAKKYGLEITKTREEYIQENKQIMNHMATLFDGNPQPMIDEVHRQIQSCIKTENFERAARLKEVYQGLENFRERQHVVLDVSMTGQVAKIQKMSDWYVYVLVRLHEGRLIDLVRNKLSTEDENINAIMAMFQAEYNIDRRKIQQDGKYYASDTVFNKEKQKDDLTEKVAFLEDRSKKGLIGLSKGVKHFTSVARQLDQVLEKFLDAYLLSSSREKESVMNDLLSQLQSKYYFKHYPYRIESIDISHLSGGWMSGGLSCILGGIPYKNHYRRYKIKEAKKSDDYKALREIIKRRFKLTKSAKEIPIPQDELPSVFILDGGKGQLGVLKKMIEEYPILKEIMVHTQFCSLEKGDARQRSAKSSGAHETLYVFTDDGEIIHKKLVYDKADRLLTGLRDEAHRFANAYRKKRMSKEWK